MTPTQKRYVPLIAVILVLLSACTVYGVVRYILQKPTTIDITVVPNHYAIEIYKNGMETIPENIIHTFTFSGILYENDPTQPITPICSEIFNIRRVDWTTGESVYYSITTIGLPEYATLYWSVNGNEYLEGAPHTATTLSTSNCMIYIEGLTAEDSGRTDIEILIHVDDGS